jgi:hypothetical protein
MFIPRSDLGMEESNPHANGGKTVAERRITCLHITTF